MSRAKNPELKEVVIPGGFDTIESGSIRINNDWKALYLRGDNAVALSMEIGNVIRIIEENNINAHPYMLKYVKALIDNDVTE